MASKGLIGPAVAGENPSPFSDPDGHITPDAPARQIWALGSPPVSRIVALPLRKEGSAATFGLDLDPHLEFLSGKGQSGHYIVGLRRWDESSERSWIRIEVTDLSRKGCP